MTTEPKPFRILCPSAPQAFPAGRTNRLDGCAGHNRDQAGQLRERAAEYRGMAATATTAHIRDALIQLAERLEKLAAERESL
jgi:hypothetical protein